MSAHNRDLLRAILIMSALMPGTLAAAADLPLPPPLPTWTWSGFYVGGQIGAFGGTSTFSDPDGRSVFGDKVNTIRISCRPSAWLQLAGVAEMGRRSPRRLELSRQQRQLHMPASLADHHRIELRGKPARARDSGWAHRLSRRPAGPYADLWQSRRRLDE